MRTRRRRRRRPAGPRPRRAARRPRDRCRARDGGWRSRVADPRAPPPATASPPRPGERPAPPPTPRRRPRRRRPTRGAARGTPSRRRATGRRDPPRARRCARPPRACGRPPRRGGRAAGGGATPAGRRGARRHRERHVAEDEVHHQPVPRPVREQGTERGQRQRGEVEALLPQPRRGDEGLEVLDHRAPDGGGHRAPAPDRHHVHHRLRRRIGKVGQAVARELGGIHSRGRLDEEEAGHAVGRDHRHRGPAEAGLARHPRHRVPHLFGGADVGSERGRRERPRGEGARANPRRRGAAERAPNDRARDRGGVEGEESARAHERLSPPMDGSTKRLRARPERPGDRRRLPSGTD